MKKQNKLTADNWEREINISVTDEESTLFSNLDLNRKVEIANYIVMKCQAVLEAVEKEVVGVKNIKFPRGEREWCVECANRIIKKQKQIFKKWRD